MTKTLLVIATAALLASAADAATVQIAGGSGQRSLTITSFGPLGQVFTATDTSLQSFGFQFQTTNAASANDPLTLTLLQGGGFGGAVVATRQATPAGIPATRTPTWFDFDLTGTTLVSGQTYTALVSTTSSRLSVIYGPDINTFTGVPTGGDAYAAGRLIATGFSDNVCNTGICDTNFRYTAVTPASPIPEPASWALMIGGFALAGGALRARTARMTFAA